MVDLRPGSETFAQWQSVELDSAQPALVYIPSGFGHAFLSLTENTVQYFAADRAFVRGYAAAVSFRDPTIRLDLPGTDLILSENDRLAPFLDKE